MAPALLAGKENFAERPPVLWEWWWSKRNTFPNFWRLVERAVLIQPSSAVIERIFSVLKGHTVKKQAGEEEDTLELRSLCLMNAHLGL